MECYSNNNRLSSALSAAATRVIFGLAALVAVSACGSNFQPAAERIAEDSSRTVGCKSFSDDFFDSLYKTIETGSAFPPPKIFEDALESRLQSNVRFEHLNENERLRLKSELTSLYTLLSRSALADIPINEPQKQIARLAALELGDRSEMLTDALQSNISMHLDTLQELSANTDLECEPKPVPSPAPEPSPTPSPTPSPSPAPTPEPSPTPSPGPSPTPTPTPAPSPTPTPEPPPEEPTDGPLPPGEDWLSRIEKTQTRIVYGTWKTMATAYQICQSVTQPPLTELTSPLRGIAIVGKHPNGVGNQRVIRDLASVQKTHPYFKSWRRIGSSCFDSLSSPLIYDYGGKPGATSAVDSTLDFFRDAGSGTKVLGTDCSGFVYSALAAAGLKVKRSGRLKAIGVFGISARMFKEPDRNGLSCLKYALPTSQHSLQTGDIIASSGHVVIVDSASEDPFNLDSLTRISQCTADMITTRRFEFTIAQSSPSLGGVGINRMRASDYFSGNPTMARGLIAFAIEACRARFGAKPAQLATSIAVVRHQTDDPQCNDRRVGLEREDCLRHCPVEENQFLIQD